jgi:ATP-dependent exoDNAse (exonuclease V) alpha subunit
MNAEQKRAFERVANGENLFITGSGGTGKSYCLRHIVKWARDQRIELGVTASTGTAAYLIRGRTLHSFLGIGLAKKSADELAEKCKHYTISKLRNIELLIIDEISMIDEILFDKISKFLSIIRGSSKPFGGIQLILCGDFAQLPPTQGRYCFLSSVWNRANIEIVQLTKMMRQHEDHVFQKMLAELRWGMCSSDSIKLLKRLRKTKFEERSDGIVPTVLYSMNVDVDTINSTKYKELLEKGAKQYLYNTKGSTSGLYWANSIKIPENVELCVGAQVVLTWNIAQESGLINGSRGIVVAINKIGPTVRFANGQEVLVEMQKIENDDDGSKTCWCSFMPLKLAYALTIHKSQGMTLDLVVIDLGDSIFEYGQAYTAISRARSLACIKLLDFKASSFKTHPDVLKFYRIEK